MMELFRLTHPLPVSQVNSNQWTMEVDFTEKIKSVFDVCDTEGSGYITVDHLKDLAKDHFGADNEEVVYM